MGTTTVKVGDIIRDPALLRPGMRLTSSERGEIAARLREARRSASGSNWKVSPYAKLADAVDAIIASLESAPGGDGAARRARRGEEEMSRAPHGDDGGGDNCCVRNPARRFADHCYHDSGKKTVCCWCGFAVAVHRPSKKCGPFLPTPALAKGRAK